MMAVANEVAVAKLKDGDRRKWHAPATGDPESLPPVAARLRRAEAVVERAGLGGLRRPDDRVQRDLSQADGAAMRRRRGAQLVLERHQPAALGRPPHEPSHHPLSAATPPLAYECV